MIETCSPTLCTATQTNCIIKLASNRMMTNPNLYIQTGGCTHIMTTLHLALNFDTQIIYFFFFPMRTAYDHNKVMTASRQEENVSQVEHRVYIAQKCKWQCVKNG